MTELASLDRLEAAAEILARGVLRVLTARGTGPRPVPVGAEPAVTSPAPHSQRESPLDVPSGESVHVRRPGRDGVAH